MTSPFEDLTITRTKEEWNGILTGLNIVLNESLHRLLTAGMNDKEADRVSLFFKFQNDLLQELK